MKMLPGHMERTPFVHVRGIVQLCAKRWESIRRNKGRGAGVPQPFLFVRVRKRGLDMVRKVAVIMGSDSDWPVVKGACAQLKALDIPFEAHILSAHRTPAEAAEFAKSARPTASA